MTGETRHHKRERRLESEATFAKICQFAFEIKRDCVNPEHAQGKKSVPTFTQFQCQRIKADPVIANYSLKVPGTGNNNNNEGSGDSDMVTERREQDGERTPCSFQGS